MNAACGPLSARATRERSGRILFLAHPPFAPRPRQQCKTRGKQQYEDNDPKRGLVQPAVELQPKPGSNNHGGQPDPEQAQRLGIDHTGAAEPNQRHHEHCDRDRLENRALVVFGPTTQARPHDDGNAGQSRTATERAAEKAHDTVGYLAALHGWKCGPDQAVDAEGNQRCPDERPHLIRSGPVEGSSAQWDADGSAGNERNEP